MTTSPLCEKPLRLKAISWRQLEVDEFACKPEITELREEQFIVGKKVKFQFIYT